MWGSYQNEVRGGLERFPDTFILLKAGAKRLHSFAFSSLRKPFIFFEELTFLIGNCFDQRVTKTGAFGRSRERVKSTYFHGVVLACFSAPKKKSSFF